MILSVFRSFLPFFCLFSCFIRSVQIFLSASDLPPFCLRSDSVVTPLCLLFLKAEMPINTGVSAISDKRPIRARLCKQGEGWPDAIRKGPYAPPGVICPLFLKWLKIRIIK